MAATSNGRQRNRQNQTNQTNQTNRTNAPATAPTPPPTASILGVNALTPKETEAAVESSGIAKTRMTAGRTFVSAMFAGAFIGFGALFFLIVTADPTMGWGAKRFVGGLAFCMGLVLVLCCGAELFTGNSLMAADLPDHRVTWRSVLRNWVIVWLGNFAGALVLVLLIAFAGTMSLNDGAVGANIVSTAAAKVTPGWGTLFVRGILCNILVCLAVRIGFAARSVADKVIGILLPIAGFVAMGFEHSVANMFFLSMGLVGRLTGFGDDVATADTITPAAIAYNLSAVTLGNIVGGTVFVALAYRFIHGRGVKRDA